MGFLVFLVFQVLKIRRSLEQMKEADIVKAIMKYLKTVPGCFCWKEHGGMYGTAGIPDIIACINGNWQTYEAPGSDYLQNPRSGRYCLGGALGR